MAGTFHERGIAWHQIVAVDWDGVVGVFPKPEDGDRPVEGAMEGLYALFESGWHIEFYSCGCNNPKRKQRMMDLLMDWSRDYLTENQISLNSFFGIYPDQINFPTKKPGAKIYVDDRGFQFKGWDTFLPDTLEGFRAWWQHPSSTK